MGNFLSSFIAELFMSRFEKELSNSGYFSRSWQRYVDDVFAVFDLKLCDIDSFLSKLNSNSASVEFTAKLEKNGLLPLLNTLMIRNEFSQKFD